MPLNFKAPSKAPSENSVFSVAEDKVILKFLSAFQYTPPKTKQFAPEKWCLEEKPFLLKLPLFTGGIGSFFVLCMSVRDTLQNSWSYYLRCILAPENAQSPKELPPLVPMQWWHRRGWWHRSIWHLEQASNQDPLRREKGEVLNGQIYWYVIEAMCFVSSFLVFF